MTFFNQCYTDYRGRINWIFPHIFKAEEEKANVDPPSVNKDKGGAKVTDKKGKSPPSPVGPSKEKKTKLKRRDDVEPPKYIGKN